MNRHTWTRKELNLNFFFVLSDQSETYLIWFRPPMGLILFLFFVTISFYFTSITGAFAIMSYLRYFKSDLLFEMCRETV